jgi:predicted RNA-binding protein
MDCVREWYGKHLFEMSALTTTMTATLQGLVGQRRRHRRRRHRRRLVSVVSVVSEVPVRIINIYHPTVVRMGLYLGNTL